MTKTRIPESEWVWMPHPAHFICARDCKFFLATKIGNHIVSTVGELWFDSRVREIHDQVHCKYHGGERVKGMGDEYDRNYFLRYGFEDLHAVGWKYETMVFDAVPREGEDSECCPFKIVVSKSHEEECYKTAKEARAGHMELCEKYANL